MAEGNDDELIGSVIHALPIDRMIGAPLEAMIQAQVSATQHYADFITKTCVGEDGKAKMIQFDYDETQVDTEGNYRGVKQKTMRIPLLAALTHPNLGFAEGSIDFELEITQVEKDTQETVPNGSAEGSGATKTVMKGRVSHKSTQTRSTDTRAKYSIHAAVKREAPPEALMRVIDFLTDAATRPTVAPENADIKSLESLPQDTRPQNPEQEQDNRSRTR